MAPPPDPMTYRRTAALALAAAVALAPRALAHWQPQYADAAPEVRDWYRNAELTPEAQARFGFKGCCDHADVVRTKFRVGVKGADDWEFFDTAASPPAWREIPADIIHFGEHAPDGQATLFRLGSAGALVCFWPPQGGI